jgi:hypothetical protein
MLLLRERRAARAAALTCLVAAGCAYPHLSTSPDWNGDDAAGGDGAEAGEGGSRAGSGGKSGGSGGSEPNGGVPEPPVGGQGGEAPMRDLIHGLVADQYDNPIADIVVLIDDVELTSDENGEFELADSGKQTFDVTFVDQKNKSAFVYQGITRRELRVTATSNVAVLPHHASVEGTVQTADAETNLRVAFRDPSRALDAFGMRNVADVSPAVRYSLDANWGGADTLKGKLMALNYVGDAVQNLPESYTFGAVDLTLKAGDLKQGVDVELAALATRKITVNMTAPPGGTRTDALLFGTFAFANPAPASSQPYFIPDDPAFDAVGLPGLLSLSCSSAAGANAAYAVPITDELTRFDGECDAFPQLISPEPDATGVTNDTPLSFEPGVDGCHSFSITHQQPGWNVFIFTTQTEVVPPNLSKWGLTYAAHDVTWSAGSSSPCESIDGFLAPIDRSLPPARLMNVAISDRSAGAKFSTAE